MNSFCTGTLGWALLGSFQFVFSLSSAEDKDTLLLSRRRVAFFCGNRRMETSSKNHSITDWQRWMDAGDTCSSATDAAVRREEEEAGIALRLERG